MKKKNHPSSRASVQPYYRAAVAGLKRHEIEKEAEKISALELGTLVEGGTFYLNPKAFETHCMIVAPTGMGKTSLARIIFRALARQPNRVAIWGDDPKAGGDFYHGLIEDCAAMELDRRVNVFDTTRNDRYLAFNPLIPNAISTQDQALWIMGAVRACWGQRDFHLTPQLMRWMFNAITLTIEQRASFWEALQLLRFEDNPVRQALMKLSTLRDIKQEWEGYEKLSITRREDMTASSYAKLLLFCTNPLIQRVTCQDRTIDLGQVLTEGQIFLSHIPDYQPLEPELGQFLRTLVLQSIMAQAFHIPLGKRPRLYIFLDEAEKLLAHDPGVIETLLAVGRSVGVSLIFMFHHLAQVYRENPALLAAVLTNCRLKFIGGHLPVDDLDILTRELYITQWDRYEVKHAIYQPDYEPMETTRIQTSISRGGSRGTSTQKTISIQEALSQQFGASVAKTVAEGIANMFGRTRGSMDALSHTYATSKAIALSTMLAQQTGMNIGMGSGMMVSPDGTITNTSSEMQSTGLSTTFGSGYSGIEGESEAAGDMHSDFEAYTEAQAISLMESLMRALSVTIGKTQGKTVSEGITESQGANWNFSFTRVPFTAIKKNIRLASVEFLKLEEFLTTKLQILKRQALAHWAVQTPEGHVYLMKAKWLTLLITDASERLTIFWQRLLEKRWYATAEPIDMEFQERLNRYKEPRVLPLVESKSGQGKEASNILTDEYETMTFRRKRKS